MRSTNLQDPVQRQHRSRYAGERERRSTYEQPRRSPRAHTCSRMFPSLRPTQIGCEVQPLWPFLLSALISPVGRRPGASRCSPTISFSDNMSSSHVLSMSPYGSLNYVEETALWVLPKEFTIKMLVAARSASLILKTRWCMVNIGATYRF